MIAMRIRCQRGSVMLISLALILMVSAVATMSWKRADTDVDLTFNQVRTDQAFYLAEAGANRAISMLDGDETWRTGYAAEPLGSGKYWVAILDSSAGVASGDTIVVQATGRSNSAPQSEVVVEAWVVPRYMQPFQYAAFGEDSLIADEEVCSDSFNSDSGSYSATVVADEGNLGSNGPVHLGEATVVGGDAATSTAGAITLAEDAVVLGDTTSTAPPVTMDTLFDSEFDWARTVNSASTGLSGSGYSYDPATHSLTLSEEGTVTLADGVYYFSDIHLIEDSRMQVAPGASVTIYVTGNVVIDENVKVNQNGSPTDFMMFSKGPTLKIDEVVEFWGAFYGPNTNVDVDTGTARGAAISEEVDIYGSIVTGTLSIDEATCVHYDRALANFRKRMGGMKRIAWREL